MYKVTIKGKAKTNHKDLSQLDGIDCQDNFTDYIDSTYDGALSGGYMSFKYENGVLMTYTVYSSTRKLTEKELSEVSSYTSGQWSDGIGEGFEQFPCTEINGKEVYISPWFYGQKRTAEQEEYRLPNGR